MAPPRNTSLRYPGGRRALWGAAGFALTYGVMILLTIWKRAELTTGLMIDPGGGLNPEPITEFISLEALADWEIAGVLLFNAHLAPLDVPIQVFETTAGGMGTINLLTTAGGPYLLGLLVPPVVYAATGVLATRNSDSTDPTSRGMEALIQFTGVLPLAIVALFVFSFQAVDGTAGPSLLWGGPLVGLVYPAVFGFVGGALAQRFGSDASTTTTTVDGWGS